MIEMVPILKRLSGSTNFKEVLTKIYAARSVKISKFLILGYSYTDMDVML